MPAYEPSKSWQEKVLKMLAKRHLVDMHCPCRDKSHMDWRPIRVEPAPQMPDPENWAEIIYFCPWCEFNLLTFRERGDAFEADPLRGLSPKRKEDSARSLFGDWYASIRGWRE